MTFGPAPPLPLGEGVEGRGLRPFWLCHITALTSTGWFLLQADG